MTHTPRLACSHEERRHAVQWGWMCRLDNAGWVSTGPHPADRRRIRIGRTQGRTPTPLKAAVDLARTSLQEHMARSLHNRDLRRRRMEATRACADAGAKGVRRVIRLLDPPELTPRQLQCQRYQASPAGKAAKARYRAKKKLDAEFRKKEVERVNAWRRANLTRLRVYQRTWAQVKARRNDVRNAESNSSGVA